MKIKILELKSLAVDKGYNISTLANEAHISKATLSSVYNGKTCSLTTAGKLAKALNVSLIDIAYE